jgi:hypothetical protein
MKRVMIFASLLAVTVWMAGTSLAQSGTPSGQTPAPPDPQATQQPPAAQQPQEPQQPQTPPPQATPQGTPPATTQAEANAGLSAGAAVIMEKGKKVPPKEAEATEKKLRETVKQVEVEGAKGDQTVASRLGADFGMTPDVLIAEKGKYQTGWGELMIAHTILASAKGGATLDQLFELRRNGMGWGQIGYGLGLKLDGIVSAVKSQSRVALGTAKADGRPAKIQSATVKASTGTKVGVGAGQKGTGVSTDVGVGAGAVVKDK